MSKQPPISQESPWLRPLRGILDGLRDGAAGDQTSAARGIVESAQHLLDHGEPQWPWKSFAKNLFEYDVLLGAELYATIEALATDMKLPPHRYDFLRGRVIE